MGRILTERKHNALAISFLLQALVCFRAFSVPSAPQVQQPTIHLRRVGVQVQVGTDSATAYYLQWRAPTTGWQTWTSESTIPEGINGVWFRAIFDSNPEDPMEWELAEDVDRILTPSGALDTTDDQIFWSAIGSFEQDGSFRAAYELNPDPMVKMSSDPPPLTYDQPTKNNQAVATPDPGTGRLFLHNNSDGRIANWILSDSGGFKSGGPTRDRPLPPPWSIRGVGDINRDGSTDLILHNLNDGRIAFWLLAPDGVFISGGPVREQPLPPPWSIRGVGDIDRDGTMDLILHNLNDGRIAFWLLNQDGTFKSGGPIREQPLPPPWSIRGGSDIDRDGTIDLIIHNLNDGRIAYWLLNNDGTLKSGGPIRDNPLPPPWGITHTSD